MRRLTLILSDLYLPADATGAAWPQAVPMPNLEWLLRFADPAQVIDDWRRWLAADAQAAPLAHLPPAHLVARQANLPTAGSWFATPVHLEARLDHVRLANSGLLRLSAEQSTTLIAEFAGIFGPHLRLNTCADGVLLLGGPDNDIRTLDPARLLDADIGAALPSGATAGDLRRLGAEIEMWLPGSACNAARQRSGQKAITALWLWGGGVGADEMRHDKAASFRLYGGDAWFAAMAELIGGVAARPAPAGFAELAEPGPAYVQLAPMSGAPSERLALLEENWFAPARAALARGTLELFTLVANDRVFRVRGHAGWKFWRRRAHWMQRLGHPGRAAKA